MRHIRFRAIHKNGGEMVNHKEVCRLMYNEACSTISTIESYHVMQYTGRIDVNGKEIYDGDVLKHHGIVKWCNEFHQWTAIDLNWNDKREVHDLDYLTSPFEIIGNIYENPD